MTQEEHFKRWWDDEGSGPPKENEDCEEMCRRLCETAWLNGAFIEAEKNNKDKKEKTHEFL